MHYRCAWVCLCVLMTPQVYVKGYSAPLQMHVRWEIWSGFDSQSFTKSGSCHCQISAFGGGHEQKKPWEEGKGQLRVKIRKLDKKSKWLALIHTNINCQKNDVCPEHEASLGFFSVGLQCQLCHPFLEIFLTNCSPDKIQKETMQNETKLMDMVGWRCPAVNLGATWKS